MAGVNKVILIGNLGKDPEVRYLENGVAVANFTLATSETYKDRNTGERVTQTEWHNIVLWRGLAEVAEKWLKKGNQIYVEGKLKTRQWQDKDNNTRYTTEIVGDNMTMLGGVPTGGDMMNTPHPVAAKPQVSEPQSANEDMVNTQPVPVKPQAAESQNAASSTDTFEQSTDDATDDLPF